MVVSHSLAEAPVLRLGRHAHAGENQHVAAQLAVRRQQGVQRRVRARLPAGPAAHRLLRPLQEGGQHSCAPLKHIQAPLEHIQACLSGGHV